METAGYVALIAAGILLGITGSGGSVLSLPVLVYLFSLDVVIASASSLFIVGATSIVGTVLKQRKRLVDVRTGLIFAIPSIAAAFSTRKWLMPSIPDVVLYTENFTLTKRALLLGIFACVIILVSVKMILNGKAKNASAQAPHPYVLIPIGMTTGAHAEQSGERAC